MSRIVNNTIARQIREKIRNRILLSMLIFLAFTCILSFYNLKNNISQVEKEINLNTTNLSDYIISQALVNNYAAIKIKLTEINKGNVHYQWINKNSNINEKFNWKFPLNWEYLLPLRSINGVSFGYFIISGNLFTNFPVIDGVLIELMLLIFFAITIFIILYPLCNRIPRNLFIEPLRYILFLLKGNSTSITQKPFTKEIQEIEHEISQLITEKENQSKLIAFNQIATQVAHDIRSPLAALSILAKSELSISDENRDLMHQVINRIRDIANDLIEKNKNPQKLINEEEFSTHLLSNIIDAIITEKRLELKHYKQIEIEFDIESKNNGSLVKIHIIEFKRMLSNLINNAAEAINEMGKISLFITENSSHVQLAIIDNGKGIPPELLKKLGNRGVTYGKNGSGLGLFHAMETMKKFKGFLEIESKINQYTKIILNFPKVQNTE